MSARIDSLVQGGRGRGIPAGWNLCLAGFHIALQLYQFIILPLLLPQSLVWAWTLVPAALLSNSHRSLVHETLHDLFSPKPSVNAFFGRLLSILFGVSFAILRTRHMLHHKLNRAPGESAECYDRSVRKRARAAVGYYFRIFGGLYGAAVLSPLCFLLPKRLLARLHKGLPGGSLRSSLTESRLSAAQLREIRFDGVLALLWLALAAACYARHWPLLAAALLARAFLVSFADNAYHYGTPVGNIFYARNLALPPFAAKLVLHFNLHGVHHVNPAIPWSDLPEAFEAQGGRYEESYFAATLRQLRGPIPLQDLPETAPVIRIRPF